MKEKTSKIIAITSLSIIGILIISVILLAVISVNRGFEFKDNPTAITIRKTDGEVILYEDKIAEQDGIYTEILSRLKTAGEFKILDSMFGGYGDKTAGTEQLSSSTSFSTLYNEDGEYCIVLRWLNTPQTTEYVNTNGNTITYQYDEAYIQLNSTDAVTKISAYLRQAGTTNTYSRIVYYGYLNTSDLYDYVATLEYDPR